jgi:hypothetical protein
MKLNKIYSFALALVAGINMLGAQATLPAFWNCNDPAAAPSGFTLNQGTSGTFVYTSASLVKSTPAAIRLDVTGEWIKINWTGTADTLWFYGSGTGASGVTAWKGTFDVEASADGSTWTSVKKFVDTDMPMGTKQLFAQVGSTARFARLIFTSKISGYNLAIDDIEVRPGKGGAKPEIKVEYSGKTLLNGNEIKVGNANAFDLTIKNNSTLGDLTVTGIQKSGNNAGDFSSAQSFPFTVKAGESAAMTVDVNQAVTSGSLKATLGILSNDSLQLPFNVNVFAVRGSLATEPTSAPSNLNLVSNLAWKSVLGMNGTTADGYLVLLSTSPITATPVDGVGYQRGEYLNGARVMHAGALANVNFDNIYGNTKYYVKAFAYNGYDGFVNYFTGSFGSLEYTTPGLQAGSYYGSLTETDTTLVTKLKGIVRPHFQVYYSNFGSTMASNFDARDTTDGKKVINCFYTGFPYVFTPPFFFDVADQNYLSREHSYPYSWMGEASQDSANYSDLYLLYLVHQNKANSVRSNYPMNNLKTVTMNFYGGKFGTDSAGGFAYEPRDFAKGALSRSNFYICATYNRAGAPFTIPTANEFLGMVQDQNVFKRWNKQFPPNGWEIARHEYVASVQKNRNPFVDHPDWACYIDFSNMSYVKGGTACGGPKISSNPLTVVSTRVYPNPSSDVMHIDLSAFNGSDVKVTVVDFFERTVFEGKSNGNGMDLNVKGWSAGQYLILLHGATQQAVTTVMVN